MPKEDSALNLAHLNIVGVKVKSLKKAGKADVYCLSAEKNRTIIANGIITGNCDALRYALFTAFGKRMSMDLHEPKPVAEQQMQNLQDLGFMGRRF